MLNFFKSHYKNFRKFSAVGLINTVVDFFVFYVLYESLGLYFFIAHVCAFLVAVLNSFILNALWTFKALKRDKILKQVISFIAVALAGLIISSVVIYMAEPYMYVYFAKILAVFSTLLWNYTGSWLFVFKDTK